MFMIAKLLSILTILSFIPAQTAGAEESFLMPLGTRHTNVEKDIKSKLKAITLKEADVFEKPNYGGVQRTKKFQATGMFNPVPPQAPKVEAETEQANEKVTFEIEELHKAWTNFCERLWNVGIEIAKSSFGEVSKKERDEQPLDKVSSEISKVETAAVEIKKDEQTPKKKGRKQEIASSPAFGRAPRNDEANVARNDDEKLVVRNDGVSNNDEKIEVKEAGAEADVDLGKERQAKKREPLMSRDEIRAEIDRLVKEKEDLNAGYVQKKYNRLYNSAVKQFPATGDKSSWRQAIEYSGLNWDEIRKRRGRPIRDGISNGARKKGIASPHTQLAGRGARNDEVESAPRNDGASNDEVESAPRNGGAKVARDDKVGAIHELPLKAELLSSDKVESREGKIKTRRKRVKEADAETDVEKEKAYVAAKSLLVSETKTLPGAVIYSNALVFEYGLLEFLPSIADVLGDDCVIAVIVKNVEQIDILQSKELSKKIKRFYSAEEAAEYIKTRNPNGILMRYFKVEGEEHIYMEALEVVNVSHRIIEYLKNTTAGGTTELFESALKALKNA